MKVFKTLFAGGMVALLAACGGGGGSTPTPTPPAPVVFTPASVSSCDKISSPLLRVGDYSVTTNLWGKGTITNFTECISATSVGTAANGVAFQTGITAKWNWDWPAVNSNVKAYPEILYRPDGKGLTPIKLTDIGALTVTHDVSLSATGDFNLTYDIFVDSTSVVDHSWPHKAEIMIKLQSTWSDSPVVDTLTVDGNQYDVIVSTMTSGSDSWKFLVFSSKTPLLKAAIHIKPFVDYLITKGHLLQSDYFTTLEFGTELVQGAGTATINAYQVTR